MITMYITPGPNNILCAVHGSQYGIRRTVPLISGMAFGWLIMGLFVAVTLEIIEGYKDILSYLTYIGACYIAFLSYHIATSKPIEDENDESQMLGPRTGLILQFVNGKAWIHDLVLLGTFGSVFGSGIESKIILVFLLADKISILKLFFFLSIILNTVLPIEPVEPRIEIDFFI